MLHSTARILTPHVGSLPRIEGLADLIAARRSTGAVETINNYVEHPQIAGDSFTAEDVVRAKLESLAEGAKIASSKLWG